VNQYSSLSLSLSLLNISLFLLWLFHNALIPKDTFSSNLNAYICSSLAISSFFDFRAPLIWSMTLSIFLIEVYKSGTISALVFSKSTPLTNLQHLRDSSNSLTVSRTSLQYIHLIYGNKLITHALSFHLQFQVSFRLRVKFLVVVVYTS
jgi:hypothetical protein